MFVKKYYTIYMMVGMPLSVKLLEVLSVQLCILGGDEVD